MTTQNMKLRAPVPFPANVTGTGGIGVVKENGIWTISPDFGDIAAIVASAVSDPTTKQIWIWDSVTDEYNVLTLAGLGDALYKMTSTTSLAISIASKTFVTQSGKDVGVGSWVIATSDSGATNYMLGQVTSYSGTSLVVNVTATGGSGTKTDWTIRASSAPGSAGKSSGHSYLWATSTASSDPTAGFVKANNATISSATALYISETDNDGNGIAANIGTWDDSTSTIHGRLKIYNPLTPANFAYFDVTGTNTDNGTWDTVNVSYVSSGGSFSASDALYVLFIPKGDKGDVGPGGNATLSSVTTHGVAIISGATTATSTAVMTDGQLLVGQSAADPLPKSITGDVAVSAAGAMSFTDAQLKSNLPQNSKSAAYTTVLTDGAKHILHPTADNNARTFTIDSNANVTYPIGTTLTFVNQINTVTIAITSDTLTLAGTGATGSRTLAANGIATALKITSTSWVISGTGLT